VDAAVVSPFPAEEARGTRGDVAVAEGVECVVVFPRVGAAGAAGAAVAAVAAVAAGAAVVAAVPVAVAVAVAVAVVFVILLGVFAKELQILSATHLAVE
jgi:hypothetical protein